MKNETGCKNSEKNTSKTAVKMQRPESKVKFLFFFCEKRQYVHLNEKNNV